MTVYHLYFSPCETTYDATYVFCRAVSQNAAVEVNLTDRETEVPDMPAGSVAVVAGPVYAGRIPAPMADKLARARMEGVKVVTFAVYGGRAYEDALLELNDLCEKAGAQVLASAAIVSEHTFLPDLERGRPDEKDFEELRGFARSVCEKHASGSFTPVTVPGNRPYRAGYKAGFVPETDTAMCRHRSGRAESHRHHALHRLHALRRKLHDGRPRHARSRAHQDRRHALAAARGPQSQ